MLPPNFFIMSVDIWYVPVNYVVIGYYTGGVVCKHGHALTRWKALLQCRVCVVVLGEQQQDQYGVHKVGQTKFTVYRHKVFNFACGLAVIIQISN